MALGGVAIGNIKAQLLAIVTGINRFKIEIFKPTTIPTTTGAKTATKAKLLLNSVINNIKTINRETFSKTGKFPAAIVSVISATNPLEAIRFASDKPPVSLIKSRITEIAIGNMTTVEAVLLIHILINAVAIIKPNTTLLGLVPVSFTIFKAILLCKFTFSKAKANRNQQRIKI